MSCFPLPQLPRTWLRACQLITVWGLTEDLSGTRVHLDAGATLARTQMFADEVVRAVLIERRAEQLVVNRAGPELHAKFRAAAARYGADRICLYSGPAPDQRM